MLDSCHINHAILIETKKVTFNFINLVYITLLGKFIGMLYENVIM
jgi:hypothetical protein